MRGAARLSLRSLDPPREGRTEFVVPPEGRFVAGDHAALESRLLDDARARREAEMPAERLADDRSGESMVVVERVRFHRRIFRDHTRRRDSADSGTPALARRLTSTAPPGQIRSRILISWFIGR